MSNNNIFISWSQARSHKIALALKDFLPEVIQAARPWISSEDIKKGTEWRHEIESALASNKLGIAVVTPENRNDKWPHYEVGALAAGMTDANRLICPFLLGMEPKDIDQPFSGFNMTKSTYDETLRMVIDFAVVISPEVSKEIIERTFKRAWPEFNEVIQATLKMPPTGDTVERKMPELVAEVLDIVRTVQVTQEVMFDNRSTGTGVFDVKYEVEALQYDVQLMRGSMTGELQVIDSKLSSIDSLQGDMSELKSNVNAIQAALDEIKYLIDSRLRNEA